MCSDATPVREREGADERESAARALRGKQDALWSVCERLSAQFFEVRKPLGAERHAQLDDRQVPRTGNARDQRHFDAESPAKRSTGRQQLRRGEDLGVHRTGARHVEQERYVSPLVRGTRDRDRGALGDDLRTEAELRACVTVTHDRVGWAATRAGCDERRRRAERQPQPAEGDAKVRWVAYFDAGQCGRDLARGRSKLKAELDGRGCAEPIGGERSVQRDGCLGACRGSRGEQRHGASQCDEERASGST